MNDHLSEAIVEEETGSELATHAPNLLLLPSEIFFEILGYLDFESIFQCAVVCTSLSSLIRFDHLSASFWTQYTRRFVPPDFFPQLSAQRGARLWHHKNWPYICEQISNLAMAIRSLPEGESSILESWNERIKLYRVRTRLELTGVSIRRRTMQAMTTILDQPYCVVLKLGEAAITQLIALARQSSLSPDVLKKIDQGDESYLERVVQGLLRCQLSVLKKYCMQMVNSKADLNGQLLLGNFVQIEGYCEARVGVLNPDFPQLYIYVESINPVEQIEQQVRYRLRTRNPHLRSAVEALKHALFLREVTNPLSFQLLFKGCVIDCNAIIETIYKHKRHLVVTVPLRHIDSESRATICVYYPEAPTGLLLKEKDKIRIVGRLVDLKIIVATSVSLVKPSSLVSVAHIHMLQTVLYGLSSVYTLHLAVHHLKHRLHSSGSAYQFLLECWKTTVHAMSSSNSNWSPTIKRTSALSLVRLVNYHSRRIVRWFFILIGFLHMLAGRMCIGLFGNTRLVLLYIVTGFWLTFSSSVFCYSFYHTLRTTLTCVRQSLQVLYGY